MDFSAGGAQCGSPRLPGRPCGLWRCRCRTPLCRRRWALQHCQHLARCRGAGRLRRERSLRQVIWGCRVDGRPAAAAPCTLALPAAAECRLQFTHSSFTAACCAGGGRPWPLPNLGGQRGGTRSSVRRASSSSPASVAVSAAAHLNAHAAPVSRESPPARYQAPSAFQDWCLNVAPAGACNSRMAAGACAMAAVLTTQAPRALVEGASSTSRPAQRTCGAPLLHQRRHPRRRCQRALLMPAAAAALATRAEPKTLARVDRKVGTWNMTAGRWGGGGGGRCPLSQGAPSHLH